MQWSRQTPLLAILVFGFGMGLGHAWKSGWIPIELGRANTGALEGENIAEFVDDGQLASPPAPPQRLALESTSDQPNSSVDDIVASAPMAHPLRATPQQEALEFPRPSRVEVVAPAVHAAAEEPEWAAAPSANRAERVQATSLPPRGNSPARRDREIRLAANHESPRGQADSNGEAEPSASALADELKAIDEQLSKNEVLPAHRALSKLYWNHKEARGEILPKVTRTAHDIFFEPRPHFVEPYVVQPNDQLRMIANKYQLSWEYLSYLNRTDPKRLQLGQKLKILKGPFSAIVDLSEFALTIHLQGYFVKRYEVGIGKDGASPIGKFTVLNKVENPQYTGPDGKVISADDPLNPLGERWLDLGDSYGIHGTIEPDSIGKAASRGCIRMREKDVIEVYNFLVKGSEVVIRK